MDSSWISLIAFAAVLAALVNSSSARVCVLGTEPDQATGGKVRFVLPPGDPCTCAEVMLGGHNMYTPPGPEPPVYIDIRDLRALNVDGIRRLFNCVASNPFPDERVSTGVPKESSPIIDTTVSDLTTVVTTPTEPPERAADCQAIFDAGRATSGVYTIYHDGQSMQVYCDMDSGAGHGYIVFQRRIDGSESFDRDWQEYANGFGPLEGEFWLGNEKLRQMTDTDRETWELVITLTSFDNEVASVRYDEFSVTGDKYALDVSDYQDPTDGGIIAGDSLTPIHSSKSFTTRDRDNDNSGGSDSGGSGLNCAEKFQGGWWFKKCNDLKSNLNGIYSSNRAVSSFMGIQWVT